MLKPSSTTPLDRGLREGFPMTLCILDIGLRGSCWWAAPQPGDLSLQSINTRPSTWEQLREEGQSLMLGIGAIIVTCHAAHMARVQCKVGIKCLSCTEEQEGPTQDTQNRGHEFHMGTCDQVGRHEPYSGHYSGVFIAPKNAQNAKTKHQHQSGAVPILLPAISASMTSAYSSLGVLQGLNSQRWLLKESVYHSATSANAYKTYIWPVRDADVSAQGTPKFMPCLCERVSHLQP